MDWVDFIRIFSPLHLYSTARIYKQKTIRWKKVILQCLDLLHSSKHKKKRKRKANSVALGYRKVPITDEVRPSPTKEEEEPLCSSLYLLVSISQLRDLQTLSLWDLGIWHDYWRPCSRFINYYICPWDWGIPAARLVVVLCTAESNGVCMEHAVPVNYW